MAEKTILPPNLYEKEVNTHFPMRQILNHKGEITDPSYESVINEGLVKKFYRQLICMRTLDRKAKSLQRQGRLGTYPPFEGQEAAQVGSAFALAEDDWMFPTYRDHAASITFGKSYAILSSWNGRVEGNLPPEGKKYCRHLYLLPLSFLLLLEPQWRPNLKARRKQ